MNLPVLKETILRQQLNGETILFDPVSQKAHCLNSTASQVALYCEQGLTREIALQNLQSEFKMSPEEAGSILGNSLSILQEHDLLIDAETNETWTRRTLLKNSALAALAPAVLSLALPDPASALSVGGMVLDACTVNADCCPGLRCSNVNTCCVRTANPASAPNGEPCTADNHCCSVQQGGTLIECCPSGGCGRRTGITGIANVDPLPPDPGVGNTVVAPRCCSGIATRIAGTYANNRLKCT